MISPTNKSTSISTLTYLNQSHNHNHSHSHTHGHLHNHTPLHHMKVSSTSSLPSSTSLSNKSQSATNSSIKTFWMALVIHSTMEGLGIGAADTYISQITVVFAILIHKIFESIALVGILIEGNIPTAQFRVMFFVFSLATPIGAFCSSLVESYVVASDEDNCESKILNGVITALAAGSFMLVFLYLLLFIIFIISVIL